MVDLRFYDKINSNIIFKLSILDVLTDWKQFIVNFHTVTKAAAEEEIRAGLEIFQAIKIEFEAFIPTAWKLNEESIDVFEKLGFIFSEMQKDFCCSKLNPMKRLKLQKSFGIQQVVQKKYYQR